MKLTWIQRLVLLILFSFLLSGCKGDMTDTGNETDVPDKNAVVTESMSEELPVEQTEESTSVLVQDLSLIHIWQTQTVFWALQEPEMQALICASSTCTRPSPHLTAAAARPAALPAYRRIW